MAIKIGSLFVELGMNSASFKGAITDAQRRMLRMQKQFRKVGRQMQRVGRDMSLQVSAPLAAFGGLALKASGDFEAAMNKVGAVSGASGNSLDQLRLTAKQMGAETQYSASQAADALSFLAMAGFNADQAMTALPGTLQLAASAQLDLAQAADIVSNVLSGYGLKVDQLARVNDVLVKTFTSANTDLVQLGEAMKYAGPIASAAGVSFEEAAAMIGMMGNAGIQASMAGTSLRGSIGRILAPTSAAAGKMRELGLSFTDSTGKLKGFDDIIQQLQPHADNAGLFMELFGQRAGPAMAALVSQGADSLVDLRTKLESAGGTAERIASAQMEGFNGALKRLKSAFEGLQIAIGDSGLLEWATQFAEKLAELISKLSKTSPEILRLGTVFAGVTAAIGPLLFAVGGVVKILGGIAAAGAAALTPLGLIAAAVAAGATYFVAFRGEAEKVPGSLKRAVTFNDALNASLGIFYRTAAPSAAAAAVNLANKFYEEAKAARDAAAANIAMVESELAVQVGINKGLKFGNFFGDDEARLIANDLIEAQEEMAKAVNLLAEAERKRKTTATAVTGAMSEQIVESKGVNTELDLTVKGFADIGSAATGAGEQGKTALETLAEEAENLKKRLSGIASDFWENISFGGVTDAFKKVGDSIRTEAASSFSGIMQAAFAPGGSGFGGVVSALSTSFSGISKAFSAIGSGSVFSGIGSFVSSALPILGAVSAIASIIKGFSSKALIGGGLNLGISGGDIVGTEFKTVLKKTFWGLKKTIYNVATDFDRETHAGLQSVVDGLQRQVRGIYTSAGVKVTDAMLDGVKMAVERIDTTGMSESEVQAEIDKVFARYGNRLSQAVGGVGIRIAAAFADVTALLEPLGLSLGKFSKLGALSASSLAKLAGGIEVLATKTAAFYDGFFTEAQKLRNVEKLINSTFEGLRLAVPKTDAEFRRLVQAQDLTTRRGRRVYNALIGVAGQFDALTDAAKETRAKLREETRAKKAAAKETAAAAKEASLAVAKALKAAKQAFSATKSQLLFDLAGPDKRSRIQERDVAQAFADLGRSVPQTKQAFADLVARLSRDKEKHRATLDVLDEIAPTFIGLKDAAAEAAQAQREAAATARQTAKEQAKALKEAKQAFAATKSQLLFDLSGPEKRQRMKERELAQAFADLGRNVPQTKQAFVDLVSRLSRDQEKHRATLDILDQIAPTFIGLKDAAAEAAQAQRDANKEAEQAAQKRLTDLRTDRSGVLFDLLSPQKQLADMRENISEVFAGIGKAVPASLAGFRSVLAGINLKTDSAIYEKLREILPVFQSVQEAAKEAAEAAKEAAQEQAERAKEIAATQAEAARDLAERLGAVFDLSGGNFQTGFDARLAQVAVARGYSVTQDVGMNGNTKVYGELGKLRKTTEAQGVVLERMVRVFEDWDFIGLPKERS